MPTNDLPGKDGIEELGTPPAERAARPALYPEHQALDDAARRDPDLVPVFGPDDTVEPAPRTGLVGVWNSIAYHVQYAMIFVWGSASQPRESDPIERLRRRYGRSAD